MINIIMGDFGKFGSFSKPTSIGEARQEPTVLRPTKNTEPEPRVIEAAQRKIVKPEKAGKPIDTYEDRVGKFQQYAGFRLGCIAKLDYKRFQHDPSPFAIILSQPNTPYNCLRAINLHYMSPKQQMDVVLKLQYMMNGFIKKGIPMQITYDILKPLTKQTANYVPFRLYKTNAIQNFKPIDVNKWVNETKRTRTILPY